MGVTAVVPQWNRRELLETLLRSLREQTLPIDEVIVVDNGSTDDSVAVAEAAGARVLRLGSNLGFAAAVNQGVEATRSEWVAILNNDVRLEADWVERLVGVGRDAWFVTGKILRSLPDGRGSVGSADGNGGGRAGGSASGVVSPVIDGTFDEISRGAGAYRCGSGKPDSEYWNRGRAIRIASMTAGLFRRELFERVGMLDERFGSYLEDVDFGLRCAMAGLGGYYEPAAVCHHRGSATLGAWNSDTVRLISRNQVLLTAKHFQGQPRWPIVAGQLLWGLLALRHGRGFSYLRGKVAGIRDARVFREGSVSDNKDRLRAIVRASETEILEVQRQTGFDWYWRVYFWLLQR